MKFVLIGPGTTSIPPNGWGAVESIVWDYYQEIISRGHIVIIVNEPTIESIISKTNNEHPDIVYIMYDDHIAIAHDIHCERIFYMSHYAYITQNNFEQRQQRYLNNILKKVIKNQQYITLNAISSEILEVYKRYGYSGRSNVIHNGARSDLFNFLEIPKYPEKSIYIGKIEFRKAQYKYQQIEGIDFAGNYHDSPFDVNQPNYLGEWTKTILYENLTNYANLILLSDGEADPLVVKEALIAGLGVVVSECASANLDRYSPFITIIPDNKIDDIFYVKQAIQSNREISCKLRQDIREYGLKNFSWKSVVDKFINSIPLKIALIGPGIMPIPPSGWGAVEILIWDYYKEFIRLGHKVSIINTPNQEEIIEKVNEGNYDFVHLHYDVFWPILDKLTCIRIAITSHYPYIDQSEKYRGDGYLPIFSFLTSQTKYMNFVLAEKDYQVLLHAGAKNLYKMKNGIDTSLFAFSDTVKKDKAIYLGKINDRKNQALYQNLYNIDFVGGYDDYRFNKQNANYLGEWTRQQIHHHLTDYGNLVLLSQGEADPLVVKEALVSGLGVVVNRSSSENLNTSKYFITIIEDNKLTDLDFINKEIKKNRDISVNKRKEIREYGVKMFDISNDIARYISIFTTFVQ
jgi:hypothetical protein